MLVLTRRIGEVTTLSGGITMTVLNIRGKQVQLGWTAPEAIRICRDDMGGRAGSQSAAPRAHGGRPRTIERALEARGRETPARRRLAKRA